MHAQPVKSCFDLTERSHCRWRAGSHGLSATRKATTGGEMPVVHEILVTASGLSAQLLQPLALSAFLAARSTRVLRW